MIAECAAIKHGELASGDALARSYWRQSASAGTIGLVHEEMRHVFKTEGLAD